MHASHLLGSELAVRMAESLARSIADDETLARFTFYVIPRPNPDASEAFFQKPYRERSVNTRATDDDRDGAVDEDPHEDMNSDGWITEPRVEEPGSPKMRHPADPRILIDADRAKQEQGRYTLYSEGWDNDEDDQRNEDDLGGVSFDKNFPFRYPFFAREAGPHQVSEVETRGRGLCLLAAEHRAGVHIHP